MTKAKSKSAKPKVVKTKVAPVAIVAAPVVDDTSRTAPSSISAATFYFGGNPYNPRAEHNVQSWHSMTKHLVAGGDKGASGEVLAQELTVNGKHPDRTHYDFVGYLERRGALTRTKPVKEA